MNSRQLKFFDIDEEKPKRRYFIVPLDTFILSLAIIVLLIIASFSLGVEKGKRLTASSYSPRKSADQALVSNKSKPEIVKKSTVALSKAEKLEKEKKAEDTIAGKYVIQVATYKNENIAKREKRLLEKKGLPAIISQRGNYLVIFVGKYSTKKEAESKLKSLKERYRDCFVRRL
jgi:hypothetical protein